jgi:hypothetical protein
VSVAAATRLAIGRLCNCHESNIGAAFAAAAAAAFIVIAAAVAAAVVAHRRPGPAARLRHL